MLEKAVPGTPGEDYPIYAEVPETSFSCDGQVEGGYYADPEAECQVRKITINREKIFFYVIVQIVRSSTSALLRAAPSAAA